MEHRSKMYCPMCGMKGLSIVELRDDDGEIIYDCYCGACGWSGYISPDEPSESPNFWG